MPIYEIQTKLYIGDFMFPMTKLEIAQYAASMIVALKTAQVCETQVAQHTNLDPDGIPVKVGATVAGQLVAYKTKPYTDVAVAKAADWISEKFSKKPEKLEYKSDR
jgi:hypothetical protein